MLESGCIDYRQGVNAGSLTHGSLSVSFLDSSNVTLCRHIQLANIK